MKRPSEDDTPTIDKRIKLSHPDRLSTLSDELILRVLALLPPSDICVCQRLNRLAGDSSIWRTHYFDRFVRPRSSRLPGLKSSGQDVRFASTPARWLDEQHLVQRDAKTNWKQQYKLRHNWSRGRCGVDEIMVAEEPHIPPMVVQMHKGVIFTADMQNGLRAWAAKGERRLLSQIALSNTSPPTSMVVDDDKEIVVAIGFEDGTFHLYRLAKTLEVLHRQSNNDEGVITSLAMAWPYLLTMSATQKLNLYQTASEPELIHSLKAHNVWTPLSVSLRHASKEIVVSIAYALPTYLSGWTVGVQEIHLDSYGVYTSSRTASAIEQHYRPLAFSAPPMLAHLRTGRPGLHASSTEFSHIHSKPNSLSYTHPYLLVSHPDNTLTLYLVFSSIDSLSISTGSRLWGHTSSVSGAHVGGRGKAVSVSRRGDELRIWELEGGFASEASRKRLAFGDLSVRVKQPSNAQKGIDITNDSRIETVQGQDELTITRGWIGFDAENVAVLREESSGKQALVVYDFT